MMRIFLKNNSAPLSIISILIIFFAITFPQLFLHPMDKILAGLDIRNYGFWLILHIKERLLDFNLPLWNPYVFSGIPLLANPESAVFYPFSWLHLILPVPVSINLIIVIHFCLAAIGVYRYCRLLDLATLPAIAAGAIFALGGFFSGQLEAGHLMMICSAAWLPWIFHALETWLQSKKKGAPILAALYFALQILAGQPQIAWYTLIFVTLYFLLRAPRMLRPFWLRSTLFFGGFVLPALGLAAVQILPTWELANQSDRLHANFQFVTFHSLPWRNLITFLIPYPDTDEILASFENRLYLSVTGIMLAATGLVCHFRKPIIRNLAIVGIVAFTFALGKHSLFYQLYYHLPGTGFFKIPSRASLVMLFVLSILAAFGVRAVMEKWRSVYAVIYWLMALWLVLAARWLDIALTSSAFQLALALLTLNILLIYSFKTTRHKPGPDLPVAALLLLMILFDYGCLWQRLGPLLPQSAQAWLQPNRLEQQWHGLSSPQRIVSTEPNLRSMVFHYENVSGYYPVMLNSYYQLTSALLKFRWNPDNPRSTFYSEFFTPENLPNLKHLSVSHLWQEGPEGHDRFFELRPQQILPRAWLVEQVRVAANSDDSLQLISQASFDPLREVIVNDPINLSPATSEGKCRSQAQSIERLPEKLSYSTEACRGSIMVTSEMYYPGWHAKVDGLPSALLRVNYAFRGVELKPGKHQVTIEYRPNSLYLGMMISLMSGLILSVALIRRRS